MAHCDQLADSELTVSLKLCSKLLGKVLPSINPVGASDVDSSQHGSPWKRHLFFQSEADDGLSESDVFISADSDSIETKDNAHTTLDDNSLQLSRQLSSSSSKLDENENRAEDIVNRGRSETGDSILTDKSQSTCAETMSKSEDTESFNDFVQYGDGSSNVTPIKVLFSPNKIQQKQVSADRNTSTLMQTCVSCFQNLFARLVGCRIVKDADLPTSLLQQLLQLPELSDRSMKNTRHNSQTDEPNNRGLKKVKVGELSADACEAFSRACQLLIDFSSFPMYCTNYHKVLQSSFKAGKYFTQKQSAVDKIPFYVQMRLIN